LLRKERITDHGRNRSRLSVKSFHQLMYQPNIVRSFFFQTVSFGTCLSNYKTTMLEVVYTVILSNYTEIAQVGVIIYTLASSASLLQVKRTLTQVATSSFSTSSQFDMKELQWNVLNDNNQVDCAGSVSTMRISPTRVIQ
jgi:hypothetical protein